MISDICFYRQLIITCGVCSLDWKTNIFAVFKCDTQRKNLLIFFYDNLLLNHFCFVQIIVHKWKVKLDCWENWSAWIVVNKSIIKQVYSLFSLKCGFVTFLQLKKSLKNILNHFFLEFKWIESLKLLLSNVFMCCKNAEANCLQYDCYFLFFK